MNPTPWKSVRYNPVNVTIEDANGVALATAHQFPTYCDSMETATRIVEAVNERDRLRDLVRDLSDALDEAWGHQPPTTDAALLQQARKAVGEGGQ